ncbi:hypothetical protein SDC9_150000 [bioreactor metagenome]|uniref:Uncharacterized protein n=1 Tax=bioreactor metagenome TaxID=1076179 RepID=A0A645EQA3_9ZZZZ
MISSNHNGLYPGLTAQGNRFFCFRARRVDHAHQPHKSQPVFQFFGRRLHRQLINLFIGHGKHAKRARAKLIGIFLSRAEISRHASLGQNIKCSLDNHYILSVDPVHRRHQLPFRIEGNLREAGILFVQFIL